MKMEETVEVVRERERERERELQFREQSSSKKRCHNSILCKRAELLDSLEREQFFIQTRRKKRIH